MYITNYLYCIHNKSHKDIRYSFDIRHTGKLFHRIYFNLHYEQKQFELKKQEGGFSGISPIVMISTNL
jgi:hypothetical protein